MITDLDLLKQLKAGDEPAFKELYARHSRRVLAFAYHMTHSAIDAEDILQETFLRLWTGREQLPDIAHVGSYLFTIARNKTLDHLRKVALQHRLIDQVWANISETSNDLELQLEARESGALIQQALARLTPQQQTVFRLSRQQGLNHEEIAAQLRLSKSRVKNLLVEALKHIRTYLSQHAVSLAILFEITHRHLIS